MWSESQIAELLLLVEERTGDDFGNSVAALCEQDAALRTQIGGEPEVQQELDRRLEKLRRINRIISASPALVGTPLQEMPGYKIEDVLGHGGMGAVYRARDVRLGRTVALKLLLAGAHCSDKLLERFRTEARAVARLEHPGIVRIFEMGEANGVPFLALEYVAGGSLKERTAGRPIPPRTAAAWVEQMAAAIDHAHQQGIVHRDLKPSNVLMGQDDEPKITDFGLAKFLGNDQSLTHPGEAPGTPSYMAPEQVAGQGVGVTSDVYALGATLYEALCGRPPFVGATAGETLVQVRDGEPLAPSRLQPGVPVVLEAICLKCLEKSPRRRYQTAAALADDLRRYLNGGPTIAQPLGALGRAAGWCRRNWMAAALMAVIITSATVLSAGAWWYARQSGAALARETTLREMAEANERWAKQNETTAAVRAYAADMRHAESLWKVHDVHSFMNVLERYKSSDLRGFEWHYLDGLLRRDQVELRPAEPTEVDGVDFSPDGQRVVTANRDGTVEIWTSGGKRSGRFRAHAQCVNLVRYAPDGKSFATCSCDGTIRLWDAHDRRLLREIRASRGPINWIAYAPDSQRIYASGEERDAWAFRTTSGQLLGTFVGDGKMLQSIAVNSEGTRLATGDWSGQVSLWDTATFEQIGRGQNDSGSSPFLAFVPDRPLLVCGEGHLGVSVLSLPELKPSRRIGMSTPAVDTLAVSSGGERLYCGDAFVDEIDLGSNQRVKTLATHINRITDIAISADDRFLAASSIDQMTAVVDLSKAAPFRRLPWAAREVTCWSVNPQADQFVVADAQRPSKVTVFNVAGSAQLDIERRAIWPVVRIDSSHDGRFLCFGESTRAGEGSEEIWRITEDGAELVRGESDPKRGGLPPGKLFGLTYTNGQAHIVDRYDESTVASSDLGGANDARVLLAVPDCFVVRVENRVDVWDLTRRELRGSLDVGLHTSAALSPRRRLLCVSGMVCPLKTIQAIWSAVGHGGDIRAAAFSPDGKTLATARADIRLWNVATGQLMVVLEGHTGEVSSLAFANDGRTLLSISPNHETGQLREVFLWTTQ